MSRLAPLLLALAFPLLAHASVLAGRGGLAVAAVACLLAALLWPLLLRRPLAGLLALGAGVAGLVALARAGHASLPLLLPPVLLNGGIGLMFAASLRAGRTPLIERIVRALHDGEVPDPAIPAYARRLTALWAALLLGLAAVNAVLALCAVPGGLLDAFRLHSPWPLPLAWWSTFANGLNYAIIGALFVLEYAWRAHRFPQQGYRHFGDFLLRVARLGPAFWRGRG